MQTLERRKEPGVIYIGRLPWGLEERGLRAYFTQFGKVEQLRLGRSRKVWINEQFFTHPSWFIPARNNKIFLQFYHLLQNVLVTPI